MPNWRLFIGSKANLLEQRVLSTLPLIRSYPRGRNWLFDIARIAGTRRVRTAIDAGANVGDTAADLRRHLKCESVYSFEPVSSTYAKLTARHNGSKNVRCVKQALGSSRSQSRINLYESSEVSTLSSRLYEEVRSTEEISIETIDAFCRDQGISSIDILKMDVQGWEMEVIKGAHGMLNAGQIRFIFSEVGFSGDPDIADFSSINECLRGYGFKLCGFYDFFRWGKKRENIGFANALYMLADKPPLESTGPQPTTPNYL